MTTSKLTIEEQLHQANVTTSDVSFQAQMFAWDMIYRAVEELLSHGLELDDIHDGIDGHVFGPDVDDQHDVHGNLLLNFPVREERWPNVHPASHATVVHMRLGIEKAAGKPLTGTEESFYNDWVKSGSPSKLFEAQVKKRMHAPLSEDEERWVGEAVEQVEFRSSPATTGKEFLERLKTVRSGS